jgi:hypothetical protein
MASLAPGHTLQPTALVHEAWLRLVGDRNPKFILVMEVPGSHAAYVSKPAEVAEIIEKAADSSR